MNAQHTPGPWIPLERYTGTNRFPIGHLRDDGAHGILAEVNGLGGTPDQNIANVRLIAAAPELLAACELAVKYFETTRLKGKIREIFSDLNEHENATLKPLRAAIAKAKGVQS